MVAAPYEEAPSSPRREPPSYSTSPRHSNASSSSTSLEALEAAEGVSIPRLRHHRSDTLSTMMFAFQPDLLPLSLSEPDREGEPAEKTVGLFTGVALVVGLQIGSGIFSSPGVVLANVKSVGAALLIWIVGGLLAWTGASSFAELGSMIPLNGGAQAYLAYAYGPLPSYLFAWTAISVLKPGGAAIIALIFGEYTCRLIFHATGVDTSPNDIPQWAIKLTAVGAVFIVSIICVASSKMGTRVAGVFMVVKVAALISITILGIVQLIRGRETSSLTEPIFTGTSSNPSSYALALYSGLWAYEGWDQVNYVAGELKNVERTLPRVIHISMAIVMALFLAANLSYFILLEKSTVMISNTVALDFGRAFFGSVGGIVFSAMVAFSCFGALNGAFFTSARIIYAAGKEGFLPSLFGRLHSTRKTPLNAMALQALMTSLFIALGGGFRNLVNFYSVASWGFYFLTVLGLLVLRIKEPNLQRPYRTWTITPLTFSAVALFLLLMPIFAAPLSALAAVGFILAGVPVYYITHRGRHGSDDSSKKISKDPVSLRLFPFLGGLVSRVRRKFVASGSSQRDRQEETMEMLESRD